jgi:hypothetical protein
LETVHTLARPTTVTPASSLFAWISRARPWLAALYVIAVVVVTLQRGVLTTSHTTFPIFRQSYHHLVAGRDLYAFYPAEQGGALDDRFKYSPTAALLMGPFALPPLPVGLLLWNLLNAGALVLAIGTLLRKRAATIAAALAFPWVFHAIQSSSSNGLVAALIVFAFVAAERRQQVGGALLVAAGALIKLFPLSAATFALFRPRRVRFGALLLTAFILLLALPLLVTPPETLLAQYRSWRGMVTWDEGDLKFGLSIMRVMRDYLGVAMPNWPLQAIGTALLLVPPLLKSALWDDAGFRRRFLCSLLVYSVIFNHQAEHQSFVIAATGLAVWIATSRPTAWRLLLTFLCLVGFQTVPFTLVWLTMQTELLTMPEPPEPERESIPVTRREPRLLPTFTPVTE